jgi:hypothetical protein
VQSAPINMLVLAVGLIGGSIHVLPPAHMSLPLRLSTLHYLPIANKVHVTATLQHTYNEQTIFFGGEAGYS